MVHLVNGQDNDWKGWALGVAILLIAGLASALSGISISLIRDFRQEFLVEAREQRQINHGQNLCIKELQINQNERLNKERENWRLSK